VAQGVPGRLRPLIFWRFGTRRVVDRQPSAPAAFTPGEIPGTQFQRFNRPQGTWFLSGEPWKKSPVTPPGIDPGTVRLVAQCLNHYATPGPFLLSVGLYVLSYSLSPLCALPFHSLYLSLFINWINTPRSYFELPKTSRRSVLEKAKHRTVDRTLQIRNKIVN